MNSTSNRHIDVHVPALTRVEGKGSLTLKVRDGQIEDLRLSIFEPPRYFEKFLENRHYDEVADIVARICGICPIAYQMSAVQALENAFGTEVPDWVLAMRRVFYCGEWLQSHSLHIHLLAAPDFLGFNSAIEMAAEYPEQVKRGLMLQGIGNQLISLFGGRSVHPVGARVGGFHHAPTPDAVAAMLDKLHAAVPEAEALVRWLPTLKTLPDDNQDFTSVAMRHDSEYPMYRGRLVSDRGLDIAVNEYEDHFQESHAAHSTALFSHLHGEPYLVGPLTKTQPQPRPSANEKPRPAGRNRHPLSQPQHVPQHHRPGGGNSCRPARSNRHSGKLPATGFASCHDHAPRGQRPGLHRGTARHPLASL